MPLVVISWAWQHSFISEIFVFEPIGFGLKVTGIFDYIETVIVEALILEVLNLIHCFLDSVETSRDLILAGSWHGG